MLQHKTPAQLSHVHKNGTKKFVLQTLVWIFNITSRKIVFLNDEESKW